jgi:hypothetical protein
MTGVLRKYFRSLKSRSTSAARNNAEQNKTGA